MEILRVIGKYREILSRHQKFRIIELSMLMIFGGILETCSVSFILPFMNIVLNPEETMQKPQIVFVCEVFGIRSARQFWIILAIMMALLYVLKNVYLLFEYNVQYKFVYGNMFVLQEKLLDNFIHRPYEYFLGVNSGEIIRVISGDTGDAFSLLVVILSLFTELIVSTMLIITIFVITPVVTLCIAVLLIIMLLIIYVVVKPILRRAGENQHRASAESTKWLLQSIQGIKELKVMGKESFFQKNYNTYGTMLINSTRINQTLSVAPRFIIEGICMGIFFVVVALLLSRGTKLESIIPMLTAVAMAAIRLLPAVNRVSSALTQVAYGEPMLNKVIENLKHIDEYIDSTEKGSAGEECVPSFTKDISMKHISYHYPNSESNVLSDANIVINRGETIGIIGPSGAGKTTSVDLILGLLTPQSGKVLVDGVDVSCNLRSWLNQVGYIPQVIFMLDDTIEANVAFGIPKEKVDKSAVWAALTEAALDTFVKNLPDGLHTQIGERGVRLSGGQRQRIGIARALYSNPNVLFFDEATSALDSETENAIMDSIHKLRGKKTMIIIAHRISTLGGCDRVYKVDAEKIRSTGDLT